MITGSALLEAIDISLAEDDIVFSEACLSLELGGVQAPMYSAGPLERLLRYIKEEIVPRVDAKRTQFLADFESSRRDFQKILTELLRDARNGADQVSVTIIGYLNDMEREELAGPKTARIVFLVSAFDALRKVLGETGLDLQQLTTSDMLMVAMAIIRLRRDILPQ